MASRSRRFGSHRGTETRRIANQGVCSCLPPLCLRDSVRTSATWRVALGGLVLTEAQRPGESRIRESCSCLPPLCLRDSVRTSAAWRVALGGLVLTEAQRPGESRIRVSCSCLPPLCLRDSVRTSATWRVALGGLVLTEAQRPGELRIRESCSCRSKDRRCQGPRKGCESQGGKRSYCRLQRREKEPQ